jgi:hypothetical protein
VCQDGNADVLGHDRAVGQRCPHSLECFGGPTESPQGVILVLTTGTETRGHFGATLENLKRILEPSREAERQPEPVERGSVVWLEFHGPLEVTDHRGDILPPDQSHRGAKPQVAQCGQRHATVRIEGQRPLRKLNATALMFIPGQARITVPDDHRLHRRAQCPGIHEVRILLERLAQQVVGDIEPAPGLEQAARPQVHLVSRQVLRRLGQPDLVVDLDAERIDQCGDDRRGDLFLDGEDILRGQRAVESIGPEVPVHLRVDQLRGDAQVVAGATHAAFQHVAHRQALGDHLDAQALLALETER